MPKGPRGEKRPAEVIGNTVKVMRIATGEETEVRHYPNARAFGKKEVGDRSRRDLKSR